MFCPQIEPKKKQNNFLSIGFVLSEIPNELNESEAVETEAAPKEASVDNIAAAGSEDGDAGDGEGEDAPGKNQVEIHFCFVKKCFRTLFLLR